MLDEKFKNKNIKVNYEIPNELSVIVEQTSFVSSVINNVLTNAIKFSRAGSEIDIWCDVDADQVHLFFRDYGIGIPQNLERLRFQSFRCNIIVCGSLS